MANKRILILANSIRKFPSRCIAGREVLGTTPFSFGSWIRPVSRSGEGELTETDVLIDGLTEPHPLDVIDVPCDKKGDDQDQPENWLISEGKPWTKVTRAKSQLLQHLIEQPPNLWLEQNQKTDRISEDAVSKRSVNHQSLYLIRPEGLELAFWTEYNQWEKKAQKKRRARFRYRGVAYDFGLTDPFVASRHVPTFPSLRESQVVARLGNNSIICVSLTHPFNGFHYKVAATVFEPEP